VVQAGFPLDYYKNLGNGRFQKAPKSAWPPYQKRNKDNPRTVALGDIDGDGDIDVVASFHFLNSITQPPVTIRIYLNDGKGNFVDASSKLLPKKKLQLNTQDLILVDVDGDKDLDMVISLAGTIYDTAPALFLNDGKGKFTDASSTLPLAGSTFKIRAADLDGDADMDLVFGVWGTRDIAILINNGKGRFSYESSLRLPPTRTLTPSFDIADVDGDGDLDIAISDEWFTALKIYENDGKGYFKLSKKTFFKKGKKYWYPSNTLFMDPDQDGDQDILISTAIVISNYSPVTYNLRFFENQGNGVFIPKPDKYITYWMWHQPGEFSLFDLDEDGDQDLIYLSNNPSLRIHHLFFNTYHQLYAPRPPERGKLYTLEIYGRPTEVVKIFGSFQRKRIPLPGLGIFGLDPGASVPLSGWLRIPRKKWTILNLTIPNLPALKGRELSTQAFHLDWMNHSKSRFGNVMSDSIR
jgi:hypothetical protein